MRSILTETIGLVALSAAVAGLLLWGGRLFHSRWNFSERAVAVDGEVIELVSESDHEGLSSRLPKIRFQGSSGEVVFTSRYFSAFTSYEVGDRVPVLYDASTGAARVGGFGSLWFGPLLVLAVGLGLGLVGWLPLCLHWLERLRRGRGD